MELTVLRDESSRDMTTHAVQCSADGRLQAGGLDPGLHGGHRHPDLLRAGDRPLRHPGPWHQRRGHRRSHEAPVGGPSRPPPSPGWSRAWTVAPGELQAVLFRDRQRPGRLCTPTPTCGVFGHLDRTLAASGRDPRPRGPARQQVHTGPATILLQRLPATQVEEYTRGDHSRSIPQHAGDSRDLMLQGHGPAPAGPDRRHRPGHVRLPHLAGRQARRGRDPRAHRPRRPGLRHLRPADAGAGRPDAQRLTDLTAGQSFPQLFLGLCPISPPPPASSPPAGGDTS